MNKIYVAVYINEAKHNFAAPDEIPDYYMFMFVSGAATVGVVGVRTPQKFRLGCQRYRIRRKKSKIRAITPFKVIRGHRCRYRSKALMRLPIND